MVLGKSQGHVEALIPDLLHAVLVDDRPHEAVVAALVIPAAEFRGTRNTWDQHVLLAIKRVDGHLDAVLRHVVGIKEHAQPGLGDRHEGVETADQRQLGVQEGDILTTRRVGRVLKQRLFFQGFLGLREIIGSCAGGGRVAEAHERKLRGQRLAVRLDPFPGLGPVETGPDDVQREDHNDADQDDTFGAKVVESVALVETVPLRIGTAGSSRSIGTEGRATNNRSERFGRRVGGFCKVRKVWVVSQVSTKLFMMTIGASVWIEEGIPESAVVAGAAVDFEPPKKSLKTAAIVDVASQW